ncbi:MAG: hypothetical protein K9G41_04260 [Flavobacteriales bacterium]|nr:hypothetical protein [Flavobacteriales bacterium]
MAVYRFRVCIEDDHEVFRDIDVLGKQRFADLHKQIVQSFNFELGQPAEYFSSDQQWYEGDTVVALDKNLDGDHQKIVNHINVPRQRFLCVTTSHKEVGLALELQKIFQEEDGVTYPRAFKSQGEPPYYTQPPPEPIIDSHSEDSSHEDEADMFEGDGPSEEEIEQIQKEAETASKKTDFKAPAIDFSKLGAISDDDDEEEDEDDDDSDDENDGGGFDDFNMDDL